MGRPRSFACALGLLILLVPSASAGVLWTSGEKPGWVVSEPRDFVNDGHVADAAISPGGGLLAVATNGALLLFLPNRSVPVAAHVSTAEGASDYDPGLLGSALAFSSKGSVLAWTRADAVEAISLRGARFGEVRTIAADVPFATWAHFSPDDERLYAAGQGLEVTTRLQAMSAEDGSVLWERRPRFDRFSYAPAADRFAVDEGAYVRVLEGRDGAVVAEYPIAGTPLLSPDGSLLLVAADVGQLALFRVGEPAPRWTLPRSGPMIPQWMAFSPDGRGFAVADHRTSATDVTFYEVGPGDVPIRRGSVSSGYDAGNVAGLTEGRWAVLWQAVGEPGELAIYDWEGATLESTFMPPAMQPAELRSVTDDGRMLVAAGGAILHAEVGRQNAVPTVTITSPAGCSNGTYAATAEETLRLRATANDDDGSVVSVEWTRDHDRSLRPWSLGWERTPTFTIRARDVASGLIPTGVAYAAVRVVDDAGAVAWAPCTIEVEDQVMGSPGPAFLATAAAIGLAWAARRQGARPPR